MNSKNILLTNELTFKLTKLNNFITIQQNWMDTLKLTAASTNNILKNRRNCLLASQNENINIVLEEYLNDLDTWTKTLKSMTQKDKNNGNVARINAEHDINSINNESIGIAAEARSQLNLKDMNDDQAGESESIKMTNNGYTSNQEIIADKTTESLVDTEILHTETNELNSNVASLNKDARNRVEILNIENMGNLFNLNKTYNVSVNQHADSTTNKDKIDQENEALKLNENQMECENTPPGDNDESATTINESGSDDQMIDNNECNPK